MEQAPNERIMPYSIEAEQAVLGALFLDPRKIGTVQAIINDEDFYKRSHQLIFNAIDQVFDRSGTLDFVMVLSFLFLLVSSYRY